MFPGHSSKKLFLTTSSVVLLIFLNALVFKNFIPEVSHKVIAVPSRWLVSKSSFAASLKTRWISTGELLQENQKLRQEIAELSGGLAGLDSVARENQFLREQLSVDRQPSDNLLMARIFNIQKSHLSSAILIDIGLRDGVKKGAAVISAGNIFAGIVDEVFDTTSTVILADDPRQNVSVRIFGSGI
ncbi:MAG: rod shape-determining protein MreC, partial [Candidatus Yanofskybacteria bacterium]|nr:rod shape-determining protein MreC [Candidatus Yanofskybacteria bacterium]